MSSAPDHGDRRPQGDSLPPDAETQASESYPSDPLPSEAPVSDDSHVIGDDRVPQRSHEEAEDDGSFIADDLSYVGREDIPGIKGALTRYRVMAWVVGVMLVILVVVGMPLKYFGGNDTVVRWTGVPHGWLYMILLITAYDLARRVKWSLWWVLGIMAAGTIPFLSFVAEHFATKDVRQRIAAVEEPGH